MGIQTIKDRLRHYICPFKYLLGILPENKSVFDLGCGGGEFLRLVAKYKNPSIIGGAEIKSSLIKAAQYKLKKSNDVRLRVYDGMNIPYIRDYDYIFMIDVLHHINKKDQFKFLGRVYNSMKYGAMLVIKDIDANSILRYFNKLHDLIISFEVGNELKAETLNYILREIGFITSKIEYKRMFLYPHYTIKCIK